MLVLKNLARRKIRTTLSVLGIAIGVAAIIAFNAIGDGFKASLNQYGQATGADLIVLTRDVPAAEYSRLTKAEVDWIAEHPRVKQLGDVTFYISKAEGLPALFLFGRRPDQLPIQRYRNADLRGRLVDRDDEIMLGYLAAENMGKQVGDRVTLFDGLRFEVVGIYKVGVPWENVGAVISSRVIQQKLRMGDAVQMGLVYLHDPKQRDTAIREIEERFPHLTAMKSEEVASNFENLEYIDWFVWVVSLVALLVGGLGVLNTMLMTVNERTREIGTLRAVGWSRMRVLRLILSEGTLISLVGGLIGMVVGYVGAELLIRWAPAGYLGTAYAPRLFLQAMAVAMGLGFLGALYPAWRASRLSPIEALKYE
jgi:putative ABC transport system permease protein